MSGIIHKIALLGREFTVQSEFIPEPEPKIRTLIYDGGRLVTSREIPFDATKITNKMVDAKVREQHKRITDTLINRASELQATKTTAPVATVVQPPSPVQPVPKGTPRPIIESGSRLEIAIAIRQTIGPFGLAFARPAPSTAAEYETMLEAVEAAIDAVMKAPAYEHIRLDEQLTMIAIRGQLASWRLADKDLTAAADIWPSIERFAYHQQKISNRAELVEYDHKLLTWAMSELGKGAVSEELVDGLNSLAGRDAELDHLLRHPEEMNQVGLLEVLLRLLDHTFV